MSKDVLDLVKKYHAFYEVLPYNIVLTGMHGSLKASNQTIQVGFDVDIFGLNPKGEMAPPGADPDYKLGYVELQKIAEKISYQHTNDLCSLEVIPLSSKIVLGGASHTEVQGMLRIRISHQRGLARPADLPEQQALKELEAQLRGLGFVHQ